VQDQEIKFGYAITGEVHPNRVWSNAGARAGDALILTKPIGTGVIATAIKFERAPADVAATAIAVMSRLNRDAAMALAALPAGAVHACTDITGFGLIGHATEMAKGSGVTMAIAVATVPILDGAIDLVDGNTPGGGRTNAQHFGAGAHADAGLDPRLVQLLYDPQTSGGLLAAVDPDEVAAAMGALTERGVPAQVVGTVETAGKVAVHLY
jgi:selenide,water dikinase